MTLITLVIVPKQGSQERYHRMTEKYGVKRALLGELACRL